MRPLFRSHTGVHAIRTLFTQNFLNRTGVMPIEREECDFDVLHQLILCVGETTSRPVQKHRTQLPHRYAVQAH
jgi:hypothetical protein